MSTKADPIRRRKLSDDVQERLLDLIRSQGLEPGANLPSERQLMAEYQVGRPAIREAMQSLQRMGLIEIKHGERPRVGQPSMDALIDQTSESMRHLLTHSASTMQHLKEARALFEGQMARIAAERRSVDDIRALHEIVDDQEALRADPESFLDGDGRFHRRIAAISGNPLFAAVSHAMFKWLALFHIDLVRARGMEQLTLDEHRSIVVAIEAADPDAAQQKMVTHLNRANALYHQDHLERREAPKQ